MPFFNPYFFIGYLIGIAFFGLFQAIFMANAGGAWDNAKKIVEVDLKEKNTPLHEATVVGDTVGDPFKDTSSVSMNPVIKFTTLFGLLATEIAVTMHSQVLKTAMAIVLLRRRARFYLPFLLRNEDSDNDAISEPAKNGKEAGDVLKSLSSEQKGPFPGGGKGPFFY